MATTGDPVQDYLQQILNDPVFQAINAQLNSEGQESASQRAAAIDQALVRYGYIPSDLSSLGLSGDVLGFLNQDINQSTRDLANQNTANGTSLYAQLQHAHQLQLQQLKHQLAATGRLGSGEAGFQLGENENAFKISQNQAMNNLSDLINGVGQKYLDTQAQIAAQRAQAMEDAAGRINTNQPPGGGGGGGSQTSGSSLPSWAAYPDQQQRYWGYGKGRMLP